MKDIFIKIILHSSKKSFFFYTTEKNQIFNIFKYIFRTLVFTIKKILIEFHVFAAKILNIPD